MTLQELLPPKVVSSQQRETTAKLIAANKAKAAAILLQALKQLEDSKPTLTVRKVEIK